MKLKIWNGRWFYKGVNMHIFACAKSRAELIRMLIAYSGNARGLDHEIKTYWVEGCWGVAMKGIKQEPGLWIETEHGTPVVRVWPPLPKHCSECGLGEGEWMACEEPDCGRLI